MPAEWEPQAAIWLSWPHKRKTWPKQFRPIPPAFAKIVAAISRFEEVERGLVWRTGTRRKRVAEVNGGNVS